MALARDLSNLSAQAPDPEPHDAGFLFRNLERKRDAEGPRPMATEDSLFRHSWAGKCAAEIGYRMMGVEETNPPDECALLTFSLGQHVHDVWQEGFLADTTMHGGEIETKCVIPEIKSSGHADATLPDVVFEAKSINGFGFKKAVGVQGKPEGPRTSALLQGALNAKALDKQTLVLVYLSLEATSKNIAAKAGIEGVARMSATWTYQREQWEPIADREITRIKLIEERVAAGVTPPRKTTSMPAHARITDPRKGLWVHEENGVTMDTGYVWECGYCPMQDHCVSEWQAGR